MPYPKPRASDVVAGCAWTAGRTVTRDTMAPKLPGKRGVRRNLRPRRRAGGRPTILPCPHPDTFPGCPSPPPPRVGWIQAPSPVTELPSLADRAGLGWLGVKRDDLIPALYGGTKVRKLDALLARPAYRDAARWVGSGAWGSGQLACLAAAGESLGKGLDALIFWQAPNPHALENLGFLSTRAALRYVPDRARLALALARQDGAVVPPGATCIPGMVALVEAGIELADQVKAGLLPTPDVLVVPLGSAGTAVGLAAGLGMAGLPTEVLAVATVEWWLSPRARIRSLQSALAAALGTSTPPAPIRISRRQVGPGYGVPTPASLDAVRLMGEAGVAIEPVYGGKAFAALLTELPKGRRVLFWHTARRRPLPVDPAWRDHLPAPLRARLDGLQNPSRRWLLAAAAGAAGATLLARTRGYGRYPTWDGVVLTAWEAEVLRAVAESVLPPAPLAEASLDALPARTDHFLRGMSPEARLEVHGLFVLIEQATGLDGDLSRFTRLSPADRLAFLARLESFGSLPAVAARGIRDLALLGYYQDPATWPALGYGGPLVSGARPPSPYDALFQDGPA